VELTSEVLRDQRCLVERQVANGVWMRMAVFDLLAEVRREVHRG
jgi:aspartate carbamoyltransferase catalytic subunit